MLLFSYAWALSQYYSAPYSLQLAYTGVSAAFAQDIAGLSDMNLTTPAIIIPASSLGFTIEFMAYKTFQPRSTAYCLDAANMYLTYGTGSPRLLVSFLESPYDGVTFNYSNCNDHPFGCLTPAWCPGLVNSYASPVVSLQPWIKTSAYIPRLYSSLLYTSASSVPAVDVQFTFRFGSDYDSNPVLNLPTLPSPGWTLDDLRVSSCDNECFINNGGCNAMVSCLDTPNAPSSPNNPPICGACPVGYSGSGYTSCSDVNECISSAACGSFRSCVNNAGAYSCSSTCSVGSYASCETNNTYYFNSVGNLLGWTVINSSTINVGGPTTFTADGTQVGTFVSSPSNSASNLVHDTLILRSPPFMLALGDITATVTGGRSAPCWAAENDAFLTGFAGTGSKIVYYDLDSAQTACLSFPSTGAPIPCTGITSTVIGSSVEYTTASGSSSTPAAVGDTQIAYHLRDCSLPTVLNPPCVTAGFVAYHFEPSTFSRLLTLLTISLSEFSMTFWARRNQAGVDQTVASFCTGINIGTCVYMGWNANDNFVCSFYGGIDYSQISTPPMAVSDEEIDVWRMWTCTFNPLLQERRLYRDSVLLARDFVDPYYHISISSITATPLYIGVLSPIVASPQYFQGDVADFRLFDRALQVDEIQRLAERYPMTENVLVWLDMTITSLTGFINDASGHGHSARPNSGYQQTDCSVSKGFTRFMGLALRRVVDGLYIPGSVIARSFSGGSTGETISIPASVLNSYVSMQLTIDLIDDNSGSIGWIGLESISVPVTPECELCPPNTYSGPSGSNQCLACDPFSNSSAGEPDCFQVSNNLTQRLNRLQYYLHLSGSTAVTACACSFPYGVYSHLFFGRIKIINLFYLKSFLFCEVSMSYFGSIHCFSPCFTFSIPYIANAGTVQIDFITFKFISI